MVRRLGPYAPLSATYASDDAVIEAGEAAELLYVRGLAFCTTSDSDGYISDAQLVRYVGVGMRDAVRRADRLVDVGLWDRQPGGYTVRQWLKWNKPVEEREGVKKRDRERKAARNPVDLPNAPPEGLPPDSARNPNGSQPESERSPVGLPTRAYARGRARASAAASAGVHSNPIQSTPPKSNPPLGFTTTTDPTEPPPGEARIIETSWLWPMP